MLSPQDFTNAPRSLVMQGEGISDAALQNMRYRLSNSAVRRLLTAANQNFTVQLRGGVYDFPEPFAMRAFTRVTLLSLPRAYGDLDADGKDDAAVVLRIGSGDASVTELALIVSGSGSLHQAAEFALGHARVNTLAIENGIVQANVKQWLPQDPGPRTRRLTFRLPQTFGSGSGAVRP